EKKGWVVEMLLIGYAFFWAFDVGIYALGAYCGYVFVSEFLTWKRTDEQFMKFILALIKRYARIGVSLVLWFAGISLFTYFRAGVWPVWAQFYASTSLFVGGFYMIPLKPVGPQLVLFA